MAKKEIEKNTIHKSELSVFLGSIVLITAIFHFIASLQPFFGNLKNVPVINLIRAFWGSGLFLIAFAFFCITVRLLAGVKSSIFSVLSIISQIVLGLLISISVKAAPSNGLFSLSGQISTLLVSIFDITLTLLLKYAFIILFLPLAFSVKLSSIQYYLTTFIMKLKSLTLPKLPESISNANINAQKENLLDRLNRIKDQSADKSLIQENAFEQIQTRKVSTNITEQYKRVADKPIVLPKVENQIMDTDGVPIDAAVSTFEATVKAEESIADNQIKYPEYETVPTDILTKNTEKKKVDKVKLVAKMDKLDKALQSFGIDAEIVEYTQGPTVTLVGVRLGDGVPIKAIESREKDLNIQIGNDNSNIRIAPIPSKGLVGIEFPNDERSMVSFREMVEGLISMKDNFELGVTVGKEISGDNVFLDISKAPHVLVAGTTGSGKSVLTNSFITSLIMTRSPDQVNFILVDPKQVEFADYDGLPHLITPVITDKTKALNALKWAVYEMERRYSIFRTAKVRTLKEYNKFMGITALPYIVIVIDELADLMLSAKGMGKNEVEIELQKLAQKSRATGIHLVLATQRPSVNVITGVLKANIPTRIALKVSSLQDSRVIIDQNGADSLLGNGDGLFIQASSNKASRIQAPFVSGADIQSVVTYIKSVYGSKDEFNDDQITNPKTEGEENAAQMAGTVEGGEFSGDDQMRKAVEICLQSGKVSSSTLQRYMNIGFNKAAKLVDQMVEMGIASKTISAKGRELYPDKAREYLGVEEQLKDAFGEDVSSDE